MRPVVSLWREIHCLNSNLCSLGISMGPCGQQLNWVQPKPDPRSLAWQQEMANRDFVFPITRSPHKNYHHWFQEVSTRFAHHSPNSLQFYFSLHFLPPSHLPHIPYPSYSCPHPYPVHLQNLFCFPFLERCMYSPIYTSFLTNLSASMECNLAIIYLTANIHLQVNTYHTCLSGLLHSGWFLF